MNSKSRRMNLSLSHLAMGTLSNSPLLTNTKRLKIERSVFSRQIQTTLRDVHQVFVLSSSFDRYLASPVVFIQSVSGTYENTYFTSRSEINQPVDVTECVVKDCLFSNCHTEGDGGCLFFNSPEGKLVIQSSSFYSCSARVGGAVYTVADDIQVTRICAFNMTALGSVSTLCLVSQHPTNSIYINGTLSSVSDGAESSSISVSRLQSYLSNLNMTQNRCSGRAGTLNIFNDVFSELSFVLFNDNVSPSIFYVRGNKVSNIDNMIMINNVVEHPEENGLIQYRNALNVTNSLFINNEGPITHIWKGSDFPATFTRCLFSTGSQNINFTVGPGCLFNQVEFPTNTLSSYSFDFCKIIPTQCFSHSHSVSNLQPFILTFLQLNA